MEQYLCSLLYHMTCIILHNHLLILAYYIDAGGTCNGICVGDSNAGCFGCVWWLWQCTNELN